mmetsp:Transcript_14522/g.61190  ORF Transcript_14522/g.61190 Transcript_14522/m.61190 type:complete len:474 (-) Transcript_14522:102-1523(-)
MRRRLEGCHARAHSASDASAAARVNTPRNVVRPAKTSIRCPKNVSPTFAAVPSGVAVRFSDRESFSFVFWLTASSDATSASRAARDAAAALTTPPLSSISKSPAGNEKTSSSSSRISDMATSASAPARRRFASRVALPSRSPRVTASSAASAAALCAAFPASAAVISGSTAPHRAVAIRPARPEAASFAKPAAAARCATFASDSKRHSSDRAVDIAAAARSFGTRILCVSVSSAVLPSPSIASLSRSNSSGFPNGSWSCADARLLPEMRERATAHAAAVATRAERRMADSAFNGASASSPFARHSLSLSTSTAPPRRSVVSESPELEKASTARAAAAAVSARRIFPETLETPETPETVTSASSQSPSASSASRAIIARRGGRMPSLRSFCRSVSSALSSRSAVSAPTLSSSPTFCTTMWISRRSCWPRRVAVNGAPGPSAATARSRSFTHAERVDSGSPPRRSMAYPASVACE